MQTAQLHNLVEQLATGLESVLEQLRDTPPDKVDAAAEEVLTLMDRLEGDGRLDDALALGCCLLEELGEESAALRLRVGTLCKKLQQYEAAEEHLQRCLALDPDLREARTRLGNTYKQMGRYDESVDCFDHVLAQTPGDAVTLYHKGCALALAGQLESAVEADPTLIAPRWNRALAWLGQGKLEQAWSDYELGFVLGERPRRDLPQPLGQEQALTDKIALVHAEQGYGDLFQFVRYLALLKARGARVIFECEEALHGLLAATPGIDSLQPPGWAESNTDVYDYQIPLLSLPGYIRTRMETVPATVPYIQAPETAIAQWGELIARQPGLRVGIVWSGNRGFRNNIERSCTLANFAELQRSDVTFYSLQKGDAAHELRRLTAGFAPIDLGGLLHSFVDTAAALTHLDPLVSVDTSVPYLAGAMGPSVWTLLHHALDWRWLMEGEVCPWYPSMRLFRQPAVNAWEPLFVELNEALGQWRAEHSGS